MDLQLRQSCDHSCPEGIYVPQPEHVILSDAELSPQIINVIYYDSNSFFPDFTVGQWSPRRRVGYYEAALYIEDGGDTIMDGTTYPVKSGYLRFAIPGQIQSSELPVYCYSIRFSLMSTDLPTDKSENNSENKSEHPICDNPHINEISEYFKVSSTAEYIDLYQKLIDSFRKGSVLLEKAYVLERASNAYVSVLLICRYSGITFRR